MGMIVHLSILGLRHLPAVAVRQLGLSATDGVVGAVAGWLCERFSDHGQRLTRALQRSAERAWEVLEFALAGDTLWQRCTAVFARAEDKGFRDQFRAFLDSVPANVLPEGSDSFRAVCLREIKSARDAGLLDDGAVDWGVISERVAAFARYSDPQRLLTAEFDVLRQMADLVPEQYPSLRKLLRFHPDGQMPLLVLVVRYFFRREIEKDEQLARGLALDQMQAIGATAEGGFRSLEAAIASHGERLHALLDEALRLLAETHHVAVETRGHVLDLRAQMCGMHGQLGKLCADVLFLKDRLSMPSAQVRPRDSLSIQTSEERAQVKQLLNRLRQLPPSEQQSPALLNGLGMLHHAAGEFSKAGELFEQAAGSTDDRAASAEAHYNAYRAALERRDWDAAMMSLRQASAADPSRFEPFPFWKYEPVRILGAGGFGVAFLCRRHLGGAPVVLKTLSASEIQREVREVFREAHILSSLRHPTIIPIIDCDFADSATRTRPYIEMEYFEGQDLESYVRTHDPLTVEQFLSIALPLAQAIKAAHAEGILHRDIKPGNVLVRASGDVMEVRLIDFGLAIGHDLGNVADGRSLLSSSVAGTLEYAAPEQLGRLPGASVTPCADIYGFGKTCCYALFRTTQPKQRHYRDLPKALIDLLERCTDEEPKHRPESIASVLPSLLMSLAVQLGRRSCRVPCCLGASVTCALVFPLRSLGAPMQARNDEELRARGMGTDAQGSGLGSSTSASRLTMCRRAIGENRADDKDLSVPHPRRSAANTFLLKDCEENEEFFAAFAVRCALRGSLPLCSATSRKDFGRTSRVSRTPG